MLDRKDYQDYLDLLDKNPDLKTEETLKVGEIILNGVKVNELAQNLEQIFNEIFYNAIDIIKKEKKEIAEMGKLKEMLKYIGDRAFAEYEKTQIQHKKEQEEREKELEKQNLEDTKEKQV